MSNEETRKENVSTGMNTGDSKGEKDVRANPPALPEAMTRKKKSRGCLCWLSAFAVLIGMFLFYIVSPIVNMAQYDYEARPVISNLRTIIELYRIENDHLPGVELDASGHPVKNSPDGTYCVSVSGVDHKHYIHTMNGYEQGNPTNCGRAAFMDALGDMQVCESVSNDNEVAHVFKRIDVKYDDLTGHRLRPNHFQYLVPYCDGENDCWVVGAFGEGNGLPTGTGYAVLEFNHAPSKAKFIATFERYKPQGGRGRLFLMPQSGFKSVPASSGVVIPSLDEVIHASTKEEAEKAVNELKGAFRKEGWDVQ